MVRTLKALFPTPLLTFINNYMTGDPDQTSFPELYITPSEAPDDDGTGQLLSYTRLRNVRFSMIAKDQLYNFCIKNELSRELKGRTDRKWRIHLSTPPSQSPMWRLLYKSPLPKRSGDLQWRVLHSVMPTNIFLFKCNLTDSPLCRFCGLPDTVFHCFCDCHRLDPLLNTLDRIINDLGSPFSKAMFILGCKYSRSRRERCTSINFLVGQAKVAIWKSYRLKAEGTSKSTP